MKQVFLILFFSIQLLSAPLELGKNRTEVKKIYYLDNSVSIEKAIKNKTFIPIDNIIVKLRTTYKSNFWIKIPIKNLQSKTVTKTIFFLWKNANIDIYYKKRDRVEGPFSIEDKTKNGIFFNNFSIDELEEIDIYIYVKKSKLLRDFNSIFIVDESISLDTIISEAKWFQDSFFIGFLFCMFFFSMVLYFSTTLKSHFYYASFLALIILVVSNYRWNIFAFCEEYSYALFLFFRVVLPTLVVLSLIQFTREFFNTKKNYPIINKLLIVYIFLSIFSTIDLTFNFSGFYLPSLGLPLLAITALVAYKKYKVSALFYLTGILSLFPPMLFHRTLDIGIYFNFDQKMQISSFFCSVWIGCAAYLELKKMVQERFDYEKQSCIQSRFTVMGETIANIAHQWRQPLNQLATLIATIQMYDENKKLTSKILNSKLDESKLQLKHMSATIDDFMSFFAQKKESTEFLLSTLFTNIRSLINSSLQNNNILFTIKIKKEKKIFSNEDQLKQVVLIILTNAKDALKESDNKNKEIIVTIDETSITIEDNAGGIPENIINKIFDAYFSTKQNKNGTGLGLYTAKNIVQNNLNGKLKVTNKKEGACFTIELP